MIAVATTDLVGGAVLVIAAIAFLVHLELDDRRKRAADAAARTIPPAPRRDINCRELDRRDRFERSVMPAVRNRPPLDHGGSPDLRSWPASTVENVLAERWSAYRSDEAKRDLVRVCGSLDRARAVVARIDLGGDR